jgi:hypothetical protein
MYGASVCSKCFTYFRHMLQVFHLDVAYIAMLHMSRHMLQGSIQNVTFISDIRCKCVYLNVIVAIHICCKRIFINVSHLSDYVIEVLSCCNISISRKRAHADAIPMCVAVPTCMRISRHEADISRHEAGISKHEVGIGRHEAHNSMRRCTSMQGQVCSSSSCMRDVQSQSSMQGRRSRLFIFLEKAGQAGRVQ